MPGDKDKTPNFMWTQNKSKKAFERLRKLNENNDDSPKKFDLETSMSSEDTCAPNVSTSSSSLRIKEHKLASNKKGSWKDLRISTKSTPKKG